LTFAKGQLEMTIAAFDCQRSELADTAYKDPKRFEQVILQSGQESRPEGSQG